MKSLHVAVVAAAVATGGLPALAGADAAITIFPLPLPHSAPVSITSGPDGNLWFVEQNRDRIGRITTQGIITEYAIPHSYHDRFRGGYWITQARDGGLWFSSWCGIARVDVSGRFSPCLKAAAGELSTGPDGNLWFLGGESLNKPGIIGRLTIAGGAKDLTEFDEPASSQNRSGLAVGPDENLWFSAWGTFGNNDSINVLLPTGQIVRTYTFPQFTDISALVTGPDGNMWMLAGRFVGRIHLDGTIDEYPLSSPNWSYAGIAAGPADSVWFPRPSAIGQVDMAGHITEHRLPAPHENGLPTDVVVGPDGNIWFTEADGNAIGRLTP